MAKRGPKGPSKYTQEFIEIEADALLEYAQTNPLPFLNKFTVDRGYYPELITQPNWERNEKFFQALKKAKALLEYKLTVGALANKINPTMAIFALKNVAGWRDVQHLKGEGFGDNITRIIVMRDGKEPKHQNGRIPVNSQANPGV